MTAAQQTVDTVKVVGMSEGLDKLASDISKVAAAEDKLAQSSEEAARVTETSSKRKLSLENAYKRLAASIDPAYAAQQRLARGMQVLDAMKDRGLADPEYQQRVAQLQARYAALGVANDNLVGKTGSLVGQTGNLAAQFQDIAVQLQGGASPFTIALQQGTQIAAVLGETGGGARGAVKALGGAFMSLISPVSIATIGAIAFGGALVQYLSSAIGESETLEDKLKAHNELVRGIKAAYGEAAKGLDDYARESGRVLETQMRVRTGQLEEEFEKVAKQIQRSVLDTPSGVMSNIGTIETDLDAVDQVRGKYEAFDSVIRRFREGLKAGQPDVLAFREEVSRIEAAAQGNKEIQRMAGELLKMTEQAAELQRTLNQGTEAVRLFYQATGIGAATIKEFNDALANMGKLGLPNLSDYERAAEQYRRALNQPNLTPDMVDAADRELEAANTRIRARELEKAAEEAAKKAEQDARGAARKAESEARQRENTWRRAVDSIDDQTRALEQQAATYGMSAGEVARYRVEQELTNAAVEAQKPLTDNLKNSIAEAAQRAADAAEELEKVKQAAEWSDLGRDSLKGFISDLRQGKSAADAFANALERIADRLLDMTLNWMFGNGPNPIASFMQAFSGSGGQRSIPTMAQGGYGPDVPAFMGMGKLPEVISSAVGPLKAAASSAASIVGNSVSAVEAYIRQGALARGIDPNTAARVFKGESSFRYDAVGDNGLSFGPTQLYTGGGLGNVALAQGINVRDPSTWRQQVDFSLDHAMKNGWTPWYAARNQGIGRWEGIGRQTSLNGSAGNDNLVGGMGQDMQQLSGNFDQLSQSMSSATPEITQGLTSLSNVTQQGGQAVGGALKDTASTIGQGANGVGNAIQQLMQALSQNGGGSLSGLLGLFSKGGGDWSDTSSWTTPDMSGVVYSANGNIMTPHGPLPLQTYSRGGIANRPQLSIFGEGRTPEAYVPLPDGRTIPVTMSGGGSSGGIIINNNVVNKSGAEVETTARQNTDGSIDILTFIDERAKGAVRKDARRNGPLSRELGAGFNGRG